MNLTCPLQKILLPVDGSEGARRAAEFTGCLGAALGKGLSGITLLHVLGDGYMSRHMANVDFRAEILRKSDEFKRIKEEHVEKNIMPFLENARRTVAGSGAAPEIKTLVVDGDPAEEIVRIAFEEGFSAIVMARRGESAKGLPMGSVASKVVHAAKTSVYVVGREVLREKACPVPRMLIPVDGSPYSMKAVEQAACLAALMKASLARVTLMSVVNLALYEKRVREGLVPEKEAERILEETKAVFLGAGVPENVIATKAPAGRPADEIISEAETGAYTFIILGRRGRSALRDLVLGGVSFSVLQRAEKPTVAVVSG